METQTETLTKFCKSCKITKTVDSFGKCKSAKDGLQHFCKKCSCQKTIKCRRAKREYYNLYSREHYKKNDRKDYFKQWYEDHREEHRARNKINYVCRKNGIQSTTCELCGRTECKTDKHHLDYSDFYDVVFLCRSCHMKIHRGQNEFERFIDGFKEIIEKY